MGPLLKDPMSHGRPYISTNSASNARYQGSTDARTQAAVSQTLHTTLCGHGQGAWLFKWPCARAQATEPPQSAEREANMSSGSQLLVTFCMQPMLRTLPRFHNPTPVNVSPEAVHG